MISELRRFYTGRKVLITGHTGFKGAWLALWLADMGAEVTGYSLEPPSSPSLFETVGLKDRLRHVHGDIRNPATLAQTFSDSKPDLVFHLAAQALVRPSYDDPRTTYETNVMGTVNLFEAVRKSDTVKAFVNITSDKCYENREQNWWGYRESDPMGGYDPYSSSKGCAELVTSAYIRSFFNPAEYGNTHQIAAASARAGNVIGGGDWGTDRLIPDCFKALLSNKEIVIRNPNALRPWQLVFEPLRGYLLLGMRLFKDGSKYSGGWNFGPLEIEKWTVENVVAHICQLWGNGKFRPDKGNHPHEAGLLWLDTSKARQELDFKPVYTTSKALEETCAWYKHWQQNKDVREMLAFSQKQLHAYEKIVEKGN